MGIQTVEWAKYQRLARTLEAERRSAEIESSQDNQCCQSGFHQRGFQDARATPNESQISDREAGRGSCRGEGAKADGKEQLP